MSLLDRLPGRRKPEPEPEPRSRFGVLEDMLVERLRIRRIQAFFDDLAALDSYAIIVVPLLAWIGWRTYKRERQAVLERKRAVQR